MARDFIGLVLPVSRDPRPGGGSLDDDDDDDNDNNDVAQWFRTAKNQDVSTGPLTRPFACSLATLTHSLALPCSLCSLRSFVCSHTYSQARGIWESGKVSKRPGFVLKCVGDYDDVGDDEDDEDDER